jgi:salicylate hydroxylase
MTSTHHAENYKKGVKRPWAEIRFRSAQRRGPTFIMAKGTEKTQSGQFRVIIVGCGLGGLASAIREVRNPPMVHESLDSCPKQVGAGIQLPPNATRLLQQWDVLNDIREHAYQPETISMHTYKGGAVSKLPLASAIETAYHFPYLVIHRADLLQALYSAAQRHGADIRLGCDVTRLDFSQPSLELSTGEIYEADVILGADGVKSFCRNTLLGYDDHPQSTGDAVYRICVQRKDIAEGHPSWKLVQRTSVNLWMGPESHAVSYLLKGDFFNVVLVCPEAPGARTMYGPLQADLEEVKRVFSGWDPALQELLQIQESDCTKWTLLQVAELSNWCDQTGHFALLGDAAHAMLPTL